MAGTKPTENQFDLQVNAEVTKTGLPQLYQDLLKLQATTRELSAALQATFSKHTKGDDALGFAAAAKDISSMVFELKQAQRVMRELGTLQGATTAGLRGERTLGTAAEVNRLTKAQKEAFKLQVATGEIKAAEIRQLKDEAKLKMVISALDEKRWRDGRLGNRDNGRLLLAQRELQALKNYRAFERQMEAERLRELRVTPQQQFQRDLATGKYKTSQLTAADVSGLTSGLKRTGDLSRFEQGQRARLTVAEARGDLGTAADAKAALEHIAKQKEAILKSQREVNEQARKQRQEAAKTDADHAAKRLQDQQKQLKLENEGTLTAAARQVMEERTLKLRESQRIASLAANKLDLDGAKRLQTVHEVADQMAASRYRGARAASQEELENERRLQDMLRSRRRELDTLQRRAAENPEERRQRLEDSRKQSRERLFGDGGANIMLIQAGLMANYQVLGGLQNLFSGAVSAAVEFDAALRQLQAISAATRNEMAQLKTSLIEVAQGSKFSATEVAQASVLLAQAGLSVSEIQSTMASVIALATASGSELKKSVDVMTSVLSVFDMSADKSDDIANKLTAALNLSKLDIDKMALGLQYAGNAAADAGIDFDELVSSLSAMANAGIRSGSTLGTGLRQLFVDIQKPSENFKKVLDRLGITLDQVSIRSQGFEGVLRNLQDKGFTVADAFQSFQIRSASAFAALSNNIDVFHDMQLAIDGTNAALEANEVQMESLAVQYDHFKTNLGIIAAEGLKPLLLVARDTFKGMSEGMEEMDKSSGTLKVAFTALGAVMLTIATARIGAMLGGLIKLGGGFAGLTTLTVAHRAATLHSAGALSLWAAGARGAAVASGALAAGLTLLRFTPILLGIGLAVAAFGAFKTESEKLNDALDEAKTKSNEAGEALGRSKQNLEKVDKAIATLAERYGRLSTHSTELSDHVRELARDFREQGVDISELLGKPIDALIERLKVLRTEMSMEYRLNIREEADLRKRTLDLESRQSQYKAQQYVRDARAQTSFQSATPKTKSLLAGLGLLIDRGRLPQGFKDEADYFAALTNAEREAPTGSRDKKALQAALNAMGSRQRSLGQTAQLGRVDYAADVNVRANDIMTQAMFKKGSGADLANQYKVALSAEDTRTGAAGRDFLLSGIATMGGQRDYLERLKQNYLDIKAQRELTVEEAANLMAAEDQIQRLAETISAYQQKLQPIEEQKLKDDLTLARLRVDSLKAQLERLKAETGSEGNTLRIQQVLQPQLMATLEALNAAETKLESLQSDKAKNSPHVQAAIAKEAQRRLGEERGTMRVFVNENLARSEKTTLGILRDSGQYGIEGQMQAISMEFERLDNALTAALADRKMEAKAGIDKLEDEIELASLRGRGYSTSAGLFDPNTPKGRGYQSELGDLSFRQQVAGRLQAASLRRKALKAKQAAIPLAVGEIDARLPRLQGLAGSQANVVGTLEMRLQEATRARDEMLARRAEMLKDPNVSISKEFENQLADRTKEVDDLMAKYEESLSKLSTFNQKVDDMQRKRRELLLGLTGEESMYQTMFQALSVGLEGLTSGISEALQRVISKTGDVKDAFDEMGRGILSAMLKVITDKISQQFVDMLISTGASIFGGGAGTATSPEVAGVQATASLGMRNGGPVVRRAGGGFIPGTTVGRDSTHLLAQPGEYVLQKSAAGALGESFLDNLNRTTSASLRQGGERAKAAKPQAQAEPGLVNVWVVSPDQQTGMSKDDIVVTVSDNISRGGSIRKLIKQVQMGG